MLLTLQEVVGTFAHQSDGFWGQKCSDLNEIRGNESL